LCLSASLLAGCQAYPLVSAGVESVSAEGLTLSVRPELAAPTYQTLAVVNEYGAADIELLAIQLFTVTGSGASEVETAVTKPDTTPVEALITDKNFARTVTFGNLKPNTTYRFRAFAYNGTDRATATKLSVDANSFVDLAVTNNNTPTLPEPLKVKMVPKAFSGSSSSTGITVTTGGFTHVGNEAITP
jgi:hypothetical protein